MDSRVLLRVHVFVIAAAVAAFCIDYAVVSPLVKVLASDYWTYNSQRAITKANITVVAVVFDIFLDMLI